MPTHTISVDGNPANATTGDAPSRVSYREYTAILKQTGTGNIVATVYNNSLPGTWGRLSVGYYSFLFDNGNELVSRLFLPQGTSWDGIGNTCIPITSGEADGLMGYLSITDDFVGGDPAELQGITLHCFNADFSERIEFSDLLQGFPFELRIYDADAIIL